jgi:hypothetical protein
MDPNRLTLAQDEFNAHMLRGVMEATGQPGETAEDTQTRCAAIVDIFRTFEAANPMEAMIASHCISLRFLLDVAMRDANAPDQEPAMLIRLRASAMAIGKSLHLWMANFAGLHARNEARAGEARPHNEPAEPVTSAKPQPAATQPAPVRSGPALPAGAPSATAMPMPTPTLVAPMASPARSTPGPRDLPAQSTRQTLLSSAAMSAVAASNVQLTATAPPAGG